QESAGQALLCCYLGDLSEGFPSTLVRILISPRTLPPRNRPLSTSVDGWVFFLLAGGIPAHSNSLPLREDISLVSTLDIVP
ncbi:hypothetical protein AVEN_251422-1, partial [Araneus ventricosus]